ncbi:SDR family oxidoreductase [Agrobacterium pusense]|uniref:SDR family oxidoreductase n=1 Tax=Agrobacterium pusense TaxID=648995 RepID=UPI003FD0D182
MTERFKSKTVIITGGARGMGAEHARAFVREGASVVIGDVLDSDGEALIAELGSQAAYHRLDVADPLAWAEFIAFTEKTFGPIDVAVNNAGVGGSGTSIEDASFQSWRRVLSINLDGTFLGMRAAVRSMRNADRPGAIVNISSVAGIIGTPESADYTASKFATRGITKAVAMEVGRYGIRVNSVHPGYIRTAILGELDDSVVAAKTALPRIGVPRDVTELVLFVASDEASYITGAELVVDGGFSAGSPISLRQSVQEYFKSP